MKKVSPPVLGSRTGGSSGATRERRRGNLLHTPHRHNRIRPPDCLPARCVPGEGGRRIPAANPGVLDPEVQEQVKIPILIDILESGMHRRRFCASCTKADGLRMNSMRVEIRIREDGNGDGPSAARIDTIREGVGFDVDEQGATRKGAFSSSAGGRSAAHGCAEDHHPKEAPDCRAHGWHATRPQHSGSWIPA